MTKEHLKTKPVAWKGHTRGADVSSASKGQGGAEVRKVTLPEGRIIKKAKKSTKNMKYKTKRIYSKLEGTVLRENFLGNNDLVWLGDEKI